MKITKNEVTAADLTKGHRFFLLVLVSIGSSIIYSPAYLKNVFYDPLMQATGANNEQIGWMLSAYAITATICYLPSGVVADKVRVRTLAWVGFGSTALLTFWYAMMPSITTLYIIFIGMGITTILIWWGIRFKLVRLISEEDEYSRNIGVSYGFYGAAGLLVGLIGLVLISWLAHNMVLAVKSMLIVLAVIIGLLAVASYLFIPRFAGEIASGEGGFQLAMVGKAFKTPVVWFAAATMFFVYFYYTGVNYTTPYLQNVMGASLGVVTVVSILRTYGVTLLSGPAFGFLAKAVGSPSRVIAASSVVVALSIVLFTLLPQTAAMSIVAAVIVVLLGFIANGVFGVVSSQLTEGKVPLAIFGTATGILSVIGFLPDTFSSTWFGGLIDAKGNAAYNEIFIILAVSALLAVASSVLLLMYLRRQEKQQAKLESIAQTTAEKAEI